MSEKIDSATASGACQTDKTSYWNPATSLGLLWWEIRCGQVQEEHTMRETEVQIGNSG